MLIAKDCFSNRCALGLAGSVCTRQVAAFASPRGSNDQPQIADAETSRRQLLQQGLIAAVASAIAIR
jgi:hypothetical protein